MKSPAFQFYPSDYLGSQRVQMLTLEEEGAYIRLLSYCWQHGSIPADPEKCARLIGKGGSTTVARVVQAMFQPTDNPDELRHDRLDREREKQQSWKEKSAAGGRKSAEMRANSKGGSTTVARVVEKCLQPNGNITSPIPFPSPIPTPTTTPKRERAAFTAPTAEEWTAYGLSLSPPFPKSDCENTFDFYSSKGWKVGRANSPMKDWQSALRTCWRNWKANPRATNPNQPRIYTGEAVR